MRLLFDENLPEVLVVALRGEYPESTHVRTIGLAGSGDRAVWDHAAAEGLILVTKDEDFHRLSVVLGPPPKVIWVRLGNCTTFAVAELLKRERERLARFGADSHEGFIALG